MSIRSVPSVAASGSANWIENAVDTEDPAVGAAIVASSVAVSKSTLACTTVASVLPASSW